MSDEPDGYYWDRDENLLLKKDDGTFELISTHADMGDTVVALRAENAALKAEIHAMNRASEYPIVCIGDGGYVLSSNSAAIFVSQEQALRLVEILADELEGEIVVPEAARTVRELRAQVEALKAQWQSVPWDEIYIVCKDAETLAGHPMFGTQKILNWIEREAPPPDKDALAAELNRILRTVENIIPNPEEPQA